MKYSMPKHNKMSITRGIVYGFGVLICMYAVHDIYSFQSLRAISGLTRTIYNHPLVVSNASLQANTHVIKMHRSMKDVVLFPEPEIVDASMKHVDALELETIELLEAVRQNILGEEGKEIALATIQLVEAWKPIRDNVFDLVKKGNLADSAIITRGEGAAHVDQIELKMQALTSYARNKATNFLEQSEEIDSRATHGVAFLSVLWIALSISIALFIIKRTRFIEVELADEKEKLSVTLKSIGDGVISTDIHGRVTLINTVAENLTGWGEHEAIGQDVQLVFNIINEQTREACQSPVEKVVSTNRIVGLANHTVLIARDGTERAIANSGAPIRTPSGDIVGTILVFSDQTEERQYQKRVVDSERKYRLLSDNTLDVIWTLGLDFTFSYVNPAIVNLTGYSPEQWIGSRLSEHCDNEEFIKMKRIISEEVARGPLGPGVIFEAVMTKKNGEPVWVEIHGQVIYEANGQPNCLQGIARDISERKEAESQRKALEEQLLQAQKMESVGRLAGGVAHDYNNMLSVIIGYTELALEKLVVDDPVRPDLEEVFKAAMQSTDITRQLLAFARQQTIAPKVIDLNEKMEGILKMLQRLIGEDIDLAWRPGDDVWPVKVDPVQIDQLTANLCVNARDAITDVGKITIETGRVTFDEAYCADHMGFYPGDYVMLAVSDDGIGMDKETLDKIFEPFYTTKEEGRGTGLGLATVFGIVKQNNGFINVYSEPNKGSTFKIYLSRFRGQVLDGLEQRFEGIPKGSDEKILIVEDEVSILSLAERILVDLGYTVLTAETPFQALQLAEVKTDEISLLLTDVVMPGMNGRELAQRLQAMNPKLKCLYMSGYTANVIAHRGVLVEGACFMPKPFSKKDLAGKVKEVLNGPMNPTL